MYTATITQASIRLEQPTHPEIRYLQTGDSGPIVMFIHGWGAFKEIWWMALCDLGRDHRCFALDLPGHGGSPPGLADTITGLADAIATYCDQLGLREIILFGHSMGGSVAVELALRRPDLLRQLFLVDAAVDSLRMPGFTRIYLLHGIGWPALRLSQSLSRLLGPLARQVPHTHGGGWLRPWLRRISYLSHHDPANLYRLLRSLFAPRDAERLTRITTPTVVLSGQFDLLVPPRLSRRLARRISGARYAAIGAAVHNPMDERPRAFCRVVRALLAEPRVAISGGEK
ncbi:MAG: alpha/beta hydrolase [Oscillochloris sp.]|nr:alpha/beta hydrolase [Oscillochloris sp.]